LWRDDICPDLVLAGLIVATSRKCTLVLGHDTAP